MSAAGGLSKWGPRHWNDRRREKVGGIETSWGIGVLSTPAEEERAKMEWIDLRACICRIDRSELGDGAALAIGRGEADLEERLDQVGERDR